LQVPKLTCNFLELPELRLLEDSERVHERILASDAFDMNRIDELLALFDVQQIVRIALDLIHSFTLQKVQYLCKSVSHFFFLLTRCLTLLMLEKRRSGLKVNH
jgi:hypothetical protein